MQVIRLAVFMGTIALAAIAQTNRGGISGTVFDSTGAVVPGAAVVITNLGTNQETRVKTSESGAYSVMSLEPVNYKVTVESPGFKKMLPRGKFAA